MIKFDPRFWLFEDWSNLPKSNTPTFINLWYIYARSKYCIALAAAGFEEEAKALTRQITSDKKLVKQLLFDRNTQLFLPELNADDKLSGPASVHDQVLALLTDTTPEAAQSMINKVILPCLEGSYNTGAVPSAFWATYLLDCALKYGLRKEALAYIKRNWSAMIPAGTVWENFPVPSPGELSCAHAWSAHLISHLPELFFGLEQQSPAWESIKLAPEKALGEAEAHIPLPQGTLVLKQDKNGFSYTLPPGVNAVISNSCL